MATDMSFLPEDYVERRIARRTNVICMSLFMVVLMAIVAAFFVTDRQRREIRDQQGEVNKQFEDAARRLDQLDELQTRKNEMLRKAKITTVLVERLPRSVILAELINSMPNSLSLLEIDLQTKRIRNRIRPQTALQRERIRSQTRLTAAGGNSSVPEVSPTELLLEMEGVAPTDVEVAQFMTVLSEHPMFVEINLQTIEQHKINDKVLRKFRIDLKIDQNVQLSRNDEQAGLADLKQNPIGGTLRFRSPSNFGDPGPQSASAEDKHQSAEGN